jgi:hypothetical protein
MVQRPGEPESGAGLTQRCQDKVHDFVKRKRKRVEEVDKDEEESLERQREERKLYKQRKKEEKKIRKAAARKAAGIEENVVPETSSVHPALHYLKSWSKQNGTWKFNKGEIRQDNAVW